MMSRSQEATPAPAAPSTGRTMDATYINALANHPDVRPALVCGDGRLDFQPVLDEPSSVAWRCEAGAWMAIRFSADLYELQCILRPDASDEERSQLIVDAARYLFVNTEALEVTMRVPVQDMSLATLARRNGFHERFTRQNACELGALAFYRLSIESWALHTPEVCNLGRWFHQSLPKSSAHAPDLPHDAMTGVAVLLSRAGQPEKALAVYNRFAMTSGFLPIRLLTTHPPVFDVHDAIIEVRGAALEVLRCR